MTAVEAHAAPSKSLAQQSNSGQCQQHAPSSLFFPEQPAGLWLKPRPIRKHTHVYAAGPALFSPPPRKTEGQIGAGGSGLSLRLRKGNPSCPESKEFRTPLSSEVLGLCASAHMAAHEHDFGRNAKVNLTTSWQVPATSNGSLSAGEPTASLEPQEGS